MYFSKWVAFTAAASIARASTDYCDESGANDSTAIGATSTRSFQNTSTLQPNPMSYKETPAPTSVSTITSSLTPASSVTPRISIINTNSAPEQSAARISNTPTAISDALSATASVHNAEITRSETLSTSQAVPSLTLSEHATIRPAMALCVPTGGLCPSADTTVVTFNRLEEATTSSSILSTITIVATSTRTVTSQQTIFPPVRRARKSCGSRSQISNSTTSQSPSETESSSIDSGSQSQWNASVMSSSTLQSDSISHTSEFDGPEPTETPTSMSSVVVTSTSTASQAHTTTVLTLYSTVTPSLSSASAVATTSSQSSGSTRASESHVGRILTLGLFFIMVSCLRY